MRIKEFAEATGYCEVTLRKYIKEGVLPAQIEKHGKKNMVFVDEKYVPEFKERYEYMKIYARKTPAPKKSKEPRVYKYSLKKRMEDLVKYNAEHGTNYSYGERQAKGIVG